MDHTTISKDKLHNAFKKFTLFIFLQLYILFGFFLVFFTNDTQVVLRSIGLKVIVLAPIIITLVNIIFIVLKHFKNK